MWISSKPDAVISLSTVIEISFSPFSTFGKWRFHDWMSMKPRMDILFTIILQVQVKVFFHLWKISIPSMKLPKTHFGKKALFPTMDNFIKPLKNHKNFSVENGNFFSSGNQVS